MNQANLERRLVDLAGHLDWPERDVVSRLQLIPVPRRRRVLSIAWASLLVVLVVILAIPAGRQAVADLFGLGGVVFGRTESVSPTPGDWLEFGNPISRQEAAGLLAAEFAMPTHLRPPDSIHHDPALGAVVLVWAADRSLPALLDTDIGILLTVFPTPVEPVLRKDLPIGTEVEWVAVREEAGLWVEGAPHRLVYPSLDGDVEVEAARLAGNVLIWIRGDLTYRLESALDLASSLSIAESVGD